MVGAEKGINVTKKLLTFHTKYTTILINLVKFLWLFLCLTLKNTQEKNINKNPTS